MARGRPLCWNSNQLDPQTLHKYAGRIHYMFWKSRELAAQVLTDRFA